MDLNKQFQKIKMKFNPIKMDNVDEQLSNINFDDIEIKKVKKRDTIYEDRTQFVTVKEAFLSSLKRFPDRPCIHEKPSHKEPYKVTTYTEFGKDVFALGTALVEVLNLKDKRVIIIGETQYDWYASYMATLCGVGIAVPVDRELPINELENIVKRSKASAIIYSQKKAEDIEIIKKNVPEVEYFIEMKSDKALIDKDAGIKYLIELGKKMIQAGNDSFEKIEIDPDEFKALFFTSGTSSEAKGVMLSNRNLAANINAASAYVKLYPSDMLFSVLPLHHCYESSIGFLYPIGVGASVAICEGLRYIVPNLQEAKPTSILAVPLLIEKLYEKINEKIVQSKKDLLVNTMIPITSFLKSLGKDIKKEVFKEIYDNLGGNLRIIVSAAAPVDMKVGKWFEGIGIIFLQGYGLTETAPIAALTPDYKPMVGSVGKAVVGADIKIDNPNEKGEGEILIKSVTLMLGYYEDEEKTKEAIDEDGYFHSGDIGYMNKEGFVYVTGRCKNVIVTQNGKNIFPEEIETFLYKIPEVKDAMVYGKSPEGKEAERKDANELIITAKVLPNYEVIKETYGDISDEKVYEIIWEKIKEVNKKLTSYKAVKKLEIKKEEFEKTSTMKIKRYKEKTN